MSEGSSSRYEPIAFSSESTVVAEFVPDAARPTEYQSEAELESEFIKLPAVAGLRVPPDHE